MNTDWYRLKDSLPLEQGDIIPNIKVIVPSYELLTGQTDEAEVATLDYGIILTQSCDLQHDGKTNWVLVARLLSVEDMFYPLTNKTKGQINAIIKGYAPNYHIIDKCSLGEFEFSQKLIDFREVFTLPIKYVKEVAASQKQIVTLNSPYKEHLSQAYARFYMRVGLPTNIPLL